MKYLSRYMFENRSNRIRNQMKGHLITSVNHLHPESIKVWRTFHSYLSRYLYLVQSDDLIISTSFTKHTSIKTSQIVCESTLSGFDRQIKKGCVTLLNICDEVREECRRKAERNKVSGFHMYADDTVVYIFIKYCLNTVCGRVATVLVCKKCHVMRC